MVVTNMFHAMTGLAVIEALVFDFPATFGDVEQRPTAAELEGKTRQPVRLDHSAVWLVLAASNDRNLLLRSGHQESYY